MLVINEVTCRQVTTQREFKDLCYEKKVPELYYLDFMFCAWTTLIKEIEIQNVVF